MLHDPIADLLTRIRNAKKEKHRYVDIPLSKQKVNILNVLKKEGFIEEIIVNEERRLIRVMLKYGKNRSSIINDLKRVSTPGRRRYVGYLDIPKILGGLGIAIISTSQGVVEGEEAREKKLGGEVLCYVW